MGVGEDVSFSMIFFFVNANAHMCEQMCTNARVDVSGQLVRVGSLLPPGESNGSQVISLGGKHTNLLS